VPEIGQRCTVWRAALRNLGDAIVCPHVVIRKATGSGPLEKAHGTGYADVAEK
jgi:hypothetical protein